MKKDKNIISYLVAGIVAIAVAMPLALATNQSESGEIFVECFAEQCEPVAQFAGLAE